MASPVTAPRRYELNALEGIFHLVSQNNFSFQSVPEDLVLEIPENMQKVVHECFEVDGTLEIEGHFFVEV